MIKNKEALDKITKKALIAAFKGHIDAAWDGKEKPWWDVAGNTFGLENEPIVGPAVMIRRGDTHDKAQVIHFFLCDAIIGNKKLMDALGENSYSYRLKCPLFEKVMQRNNGKDKGPEL
jgi:hypothetical protein